MRRVLTALACLALLAGLVLLGCSRDPLTDPASPEPATVTPLTAGKSSATMVPDGDVDRYGWIPHPVDPFTLYDKIDNGVGWPYSELIYTFNAGHHATFSFTDLAGGGDIDANELTITTELWPGLAGAIAVKLKLWYYIDGEEQGYDECECGQMNEVACGDTVWVLTFDDVCYDRDDINSLEVKIETAGVHWDTGISSMEVYAMEASVDYDAVCDPEISDLEVLRHGNNFAILFDTSCDATDEVIWGYAPDALVYSASSPGSGTTHVVNFTADGEEGCVYLKAIATGTTCSALADTSGLQTNVKEVVISDVERVFDPLDCRFEISWDTNVKSSSKVYWGYRCDQLTNVAYGAGDVTSHFVTIDPTGIPVKKRVYIKVESATGCDSAQSDCDFVVRQYCISP